MYQYWMSPSNLKYEAMKRVERICLWTATHMPTEIRKWVVVDATNEARRMYPDPSGYEGPEGLEFKHIYDGALRQRRIH